MLNTAKTIWESTNSGTVFCFACDRNYLLRQRGPTFVEDLCVMLFIFNSLACIQNSARLLSEATFMECVNTKGGLLLFLDYNISFINNI